MSASILADAVRAMPDEKLAAIARGFTTERLAAIVRELPNESLLPILVELAHGEATEPEGSPSRKRPSRPPVVKKHREHKRRTESTKGERSASSREDVAAALVSLAGGKGEWVRCAAIEEKTGLGSNQVRQALYRLREEDLAEHNGKNAKGSRWRPKQAREQAPKPTRAKKAKAVDEEEAPVPAIEAPTIPTLGDDLAEVIVPRELVAIEEPPKKAPAKPSKAIVFPLPVKKSSKVVHPPASPVHLPIVAVADIRSGDDRFHCAPYNAKLRAADCVGRQSTATSKLPDGEGVTSANMQQRVKRAALVSQKCVNCAIGKAVRERVTAAAKKTATKPAA